MIFFSSYDTSNGISRTEDGELKTFDDGAAIVVHGSTSWTAPDGKKYEIVFTADENGYHPSFKLSAWIDTFIWGVHTYVCNTIGSSLT